MRSSPSNGLRLIAQKLPMAQTTSSAENEGEAGTGVGRPCDSSYTRRLSSRRSTGGAPCQQSHCERRRLRRPLAYETSLIAEPNAPLILFVQNQPSRVLLRGRSCMRMNFETPITFARLFYWVSRFHGCPGFDETFPCGNKTGRFWPTVKKPMQFSSDF